MLLCGLDIENLDHLFFSCTFSKNKKNKKKFWNNSVTKMESSMGEKDVARNSSMDDSVLQREISPQYVPRAS